MNTPLSQCHAWQTADGLRKSAKDHTTEVGPISVLSHGGREFNSLFVKIWRLTHQQPLGKGMWEGGREQRRVVEGGRVQEEGWRDGGRGGREGGMEGGGREEGREGGREGRGGEGGEGGRGGREGGRKGGRERGREGGRDGGRRREGGSKGMVGEGTREGEREGESKGREVGSDDVRQAESVSGGRDG